MNKHLRNTRQHTDNSMDAEIIRGISLGMDTILWPMGEKQRLLATLEGGNVMKKKVSLAALACALLMILLCSSAVGLTIHNEVPAAPPIARVEKISFVIPAEEEYPSQVLIIEKMHYDGANLLIGYRMEGDVNTAEETFDDTVNAARRAKEGGIFDGEDAKKILNAFPSIRKGDRFCSRSYVLNRWEWVLDNTLEAGCERTYVVYGEDGLTYLCFEGLSEALRDQEALSIRLPLLKTHTRAVWYNVDESVYFGMVGRYGNTKAIALSVPRNGEETVFPVSDNVRESAVDMVMEDESHFLLRAQDGFPEYRITIHEAVMQGSQMRLVIEADGHETVQEGLQRVDPIYAHWSAPWNTEIELEEYKQRLYSPMLEKAQGMEPGDVISSLYVGVDYILQDELGEDRIGNAPWHLTSFRYEMDGKDAQLFMPSGFGDEAPPWYGQDEYVVYVPLVRYVKALRMEEDGRVSSFGVNLPDSMPVLPVKVTRIGEEGHLWNDPVYSAYSDVEMTGEGCFTIDDSVLLEIVHASYDGENIEIGYKLQENDRYRVSQELETVHWELTGPWTDLSVSYEDGVIYHRYRLRETMDPNDEVAVHTAPKQNWLDQEQVAVSLVIGELKNGTLSTQGTPRIRMLLQNKGK